MKPFDLTPSPRVLLVLTETAMKPIDALCELVDNAIDSFRSAKVDATRVNEIRIDIPTQGALRADAAALIRVTDNGPGMTPDDAEKALTAAYSSRESHGNLGLFGVGLNIATGKFAQKTRLITATKESQSAIVVEVDLGDMVRQHSFEAQPMEKPKSDYHFAPEESGTIIELSGRWPLGNTNHDFPKKLIQNGPGLIRDQLGRRYATYLRPGSPVQINLLVNGEKCEPFEHCVWDKSRSVPYGPLGRMISAREEFDHSVENRDRCLECGAPVEGGCCIADKSHSGFERVDERIRGWIGVQRYDDNSHFGIDLIRNGRAIRVLEKGAFFTFTDDEGKQIVDYPIDGPFGRIVGEVHLDHVPVNFTKGDFDRSTKEWEDAMTFLRGNSSLQAKQPGASDNNTPLMRIYTGYRRVRKAGPGDLYMAEIGENNKPGRIAREVEKDFLERFHRKEEGYYDDAKWFERVNVSSSEGDYKDCPNPSCEGQNPPAAEECSLCGHVIKAKECVKCGKQIPQSADSCKHCGKPQVPEGPWQCEVCKHTKNSPDSHECAACHAPKGAVNPFDEAVLRENSSRDDDLSERDIAIELPGGGMSDKFNLHVRKASLRKGDESHFPSVVFTSQRDREVTVYLDRTHPLFLSLQFRPHHAAALAAADFIFADSASTAHKNEHNLIVLAWRILEKYWDSDLSDDPEQVREDVRSLLDDIRDRMAENLQDVAKDIFVAMSSRDKKDMVSAMTENSVDISSMERLRDSGGFMRHIPPSSVVAIFQDYPDQFFGKRVWSAPWDIPGVLDEVASAHQTQLKQSYLNCLEDCASFLRYQRPPLVAVRRAKLSIEFLTRGFVQ